MAIPTLTYGLEVCNISPKILSKLDAAARSGLKSLFDISKYGKNYLNGLFRIESISRIIQRNKLNFVKQLLDNAFTRHVLLEMLASNLSYPSFVNGLSETANELQVNLGEIIFLGQKPTISAQFDLIPEVIEERLRFCVEYWNMQPLRKEFKTILENRIQRREGAV